MLNAAIEVETYIKRRDPDFGKPKKKFWTDLGMTRRREKLTNPRRDNKVKHTPPVEGTIKGNA